MRITWLTLADVRAERGGATSNVASARYRVLLPAQALYRAGHHASVTTIANSNDPMLRAGLSADVVVFSGRLHPDSVTLANEARRCGAGVVVDICDHHFSQPGGDDLYRHMIEAADGVVTNTPTMAQRIEHFTGRHAAVIGDPFEGPGGEADFSPGPESVRLLWFGHEQNFDTFISAIPYFNAASTVRALDVTAMTGPIDGINETLVEFNAKTQFPVHLRYEPWSVAATWQALQNTDIVVIPSAASEAHQTKSANRVIETLHAGRFVVAHRVPAYNEFRNYTYLGEDLSAGITWAVRHPQEAWTRIAQGQRAVNEDYAPAIIGRKWLKLFTEMRTSGVRSHDARRTATPAVRLNLGCGDKRLPGYINVDVADERLGTKPDVNCDVRKLDRFANDSVDEVLSVHIVERFWRWEVLDVLREWVRVLKPGGQLIIECPNLLTACIEFVNDPERGADDGPDGQRTMWVLYGDPRWHNPSMVKRWGYTAQSLAKLMTQAGLVNVHQDAAEYKLREPRDMRVAGEKPLTTAQFHRAPDSTHGIQGRR